MEAILLVRDRQWAESALARSAGSPATIEAEPSLICATRNVGEPGPGRRDVAAEKPSGMRLLVNAIGVFGFVIALSLSLLAFLPVIAGYRPAVVVSGSMAPALRVADVLVTESAEGRSLPEGAVINYRSGERLTVHRIVAVTESGYRTKGDANPTFDSSLVAHGDVEGVGVMVVPFVGLPALLIAQDRWLELVGLAAVLMVCAVTSSSRWLEGLDAEPSRP